MAQSERKRCLTWLCDKTDDTHLQDLPRTPQQEAEDLKRQKLSETFIPYLEKWHEIFEYVKKESQMLPTAHPNLPFMRFQDVPWPITRYNSELENFPPSPLATIWIREFFTMGSIPEFFQEVSLNYLFWCKTDLKRILIPYVILEDRDRTQRLAAEICRMMQPHAELAMDLQELWLARKRRQCAMKYWIPPSKPRMGKTFWNPSIDEVEQLQICMDSTLKIDEKEEDDGVD